MHGELGKRTRRTEKITKRGGESRTHLQGRPGKKVDADGQDSKYKFQECQKYGLERIGKKHKKEEDTGGTLPEKEYAKGNRKCLICYGEWVQLPANGTLTG